jgi:hypothetical protein
LPFVATVPSLTVPVVAVTTVTVSAVPELVNVTFTAVLAPFQPLHTEAAVIGSE